MNYKFPAIRGIQAGCEFYTIMVKLGELQSFIPDVDQTLAAEERAQRQLNKKRIPAIKRYILENDESYVFSALACSVDGSISFIPDKANESLGVLEIHKNSRILINDGQHRKTAIVEALKENSNLANESIPVVIFKDKGLRKSQQMFTDLNKHAVKTSNSISELYDSKDELAEITRILLQKVEFIDKYTDREKDGLSKYSKMLFTFNTFYKANGRILKGKSLAHEDAEFIVKYWKCVVDNILLWDKLEKGEIPKARLREDYLVCQAVVIEALGQMGAYFITHDEEMEKVLCGLQNIDWHRSSKLWKNRCVKDNDKMIKSQKAIIMTCNAIKKALNIPLTEDEKVYEKKKR